MKTTTIALLLALSTATAFVIPSPTLKSSSLNLNDAVEDAIAEAQNACSDDPNSTECKVAWDIVEELEAANSHRGATVPATQLSASDEAAPLLNGFDILAQKTDLKMGQLKVLMEQLAERGVTDPSLDRLHQLSQEVSDALADAKAVLDQY